MFLQSSSDRGRLPIAQPGLIGTRERKWNGKPIEIPENEMGSQLRYRTYIVQVCIGSCWNINVTGSMRETYRMNFWHFSRKQECIETKNTSPASDVKKSTNPSSSETDMMSKCENSLRWQILPYCFVHLFIPQSWLICIAKNILKCNVMNRFVCDISEII